MPAGCAERERRHGHARTHDGALVDRVAGLAPPVDRSRSPPKRRRGRVAPRTARESSESWNGEITTGALSIGIGVNRTPLTLDRPSSGLDWPTRSPISKDAVADLLQK